MATIKMADQPKFSARTIYDTANGVQDAGEPNLSLIATAPYFISIAAVPATTTIDVQIKLMADGTWVTIGSYTDCDPQMVVFDARPNFARVQRSVGSDDVRVDVQGES